MGELPTKQCLVKELGSLLRAGLGRSRRGLSEASVQHLSDLSAELVEDPDSDWTLRIARVVTVEIASIPQAPERLAIGDIFGVELDGNRSVDEIMEDIKGGVAVPALSGHQGRYIQAGQRFCDARRPDGYKESYVEDTLRNKWLEKVAERLLKRAKALPAASTVQPSDVQEGSPATLLVAITGAVLVVLGVAWLIAVATGAIG